MSHTSAFGFFTPVVSEGNIPELTQLQAVVINLYQVLVRWGVSDQVGTNYDINDYSFEILRAPIEEDSEFEEVSVPLQGITEFLDLPPSLESTWRKIFYKVRVTHIASGETKTFGPVSIHESQTLSRIGLSIVTHFNLYLRKYPVGVPAYVWTQRQWGGRCTCWNPVRGRSDNEHCVSCFGTGFYYPYSSVPILAYLAINTDVELTQFQDGEKEEDDRNMWTTNYPDFKKRDVVLMPAKNHGLYRVTGKQVMAAEASLAIVKQGVQLTRIHRDSPEYHHLHFAHDLDKIRDYMDIIWQRGKKTYFGCRTGRPLQPTQRRVVENFETHINVNKDVEP